MRNLTLAFIIAIVVVVLGFGVWFYFSDKSELTNMDNDSDISENVETKDNDSANEAAKTEPDDSEVTIKNDDGSFNITVGVNGSEDGFGDVKEFNLKGVNFAFDVKEIKVKKGDTVTINFMSEAGFHDFVLDDFKVKTKQLKAGETDSVEFVADKTGTYEYYCSVGEHRQMGMVGRLIVE